MGLMVSNNSDAEVVEPTHFPFNYACMHAQAHMCCRVFAHKLVDAGGCGHEIVATMLASTKNMSTAAGHTYRKILYD